MHKPREINVNISAEPFTVCVYLKFKNTLAIEYWKSCKFEQRDTYQITI
jgi:hypothetical protein